MFYRSDQLIKITFLLHIANRNSYDIQRWEGTFICVCELITIAIRRQLLGTITHMTYTCIMDSTSKQYDTTRYLRVSILSKAIC